MSIPKLTLSTALTSVESMPNSPINELVIIRPLSNTGKAIRLKIRLSLQGKPSIKATVEQIKHKPTAYFGMQTLKLSQVNKGRGTKATYLINDPLAIAKATYEFFHSSVVTLSSYNAYVSYTSLSDELETALHIYLKDFSEYYDKGVNPQHLIEMDCLGVAPTRRLVKPLSDHYSRIKFLHNVTSADSDIDDNIGTSNKENKNNIDKGEK